MMDRTLITAHSGAENTVDNTLESVRTLAALGADALEVDVRRADGRLVLSHDDPGSAGNCDLLEDCLRIVAAQEGLRVNIDLKQPGMVREIAALAQELGAENRLLFTGDVSADDMACAKERGLELWLNDSCLPGGGDLLAGVSAAGWQVLNVCHRDVTGGMLLQAGRLSVWTVNEEADLCRFLAAGVKNITTRRPKLALRLRGMIQNFHRAWDAFPGSARLIDREGFVLASNDRARRAGFLEGVRCAQVETANHHQNCLLRRAFETGEGQFDVSPSGLLRVWTPVSEWDGAVLHLSYKK